MWFYADVGHTQDAKKELVQIMNFADSDSVFITPKPTRLIERIMRIATNPGDLVLDSFAGSGTTGHTILKLNRITPEEEPRRFILVEMEPNIAREVTAERVRRVAEGYANAKGDRVEGLGGGFRYCELGEPLFDETGKIRESVRFADLARHVYFTETGEPLPRERVPNSPFLGACRGMGIYLLYNGILNDKSANGGNVLTRAVVGALPPFDGPKVIYCAAACSGVTGWPRSASSCGRLPTRSRCRDGETVRSVADSDDPRSQSIARRELGRTLRRADKGVEPGSEEKRRSVPGGLPFSIEPSGTRGAEVAIGRLGFSRF